MGNTDVPRRTHSPLYRELSGFKFKVKRDWPWSSIHGLCPPPPKHPQLFSLLSLKEHYRLNSSFGFVLSIYFHISILFSN